MCFWSVLFSAAFAGTKRNLPGSSFFLANSCRNPFSLGIIRNFKQFLFSYQDFFFWRAVVMLWFWKILCLPCDTSPKRYLPHPACHRWGAQPLATCSIGSGALEPYLEPPQKSNSWNLSILNHHQSSEILREIFGEWMWNCTWISEMLENLVATLQCGKYLCWKMIV